MLVTIYKRCIVSTELELISNSSDVEENGGIWFTVLRIAWEF